MGKSDKGVTSLMTDVLKITARTIKPLMSTGVMNGKIDDFIKAYLMEFPVEE